jgi:hypothetical protein
MPPEVDQLGQRGAALAHGCERAATQAVVEYLRASMAASDTSMPRAWSICAARVSCTILYARLTERAVLGIVVLAGASSSSVGHAP